MEEVFKNEEQMKYISKRIKKAMSFLLNASDKYLKKQGLAGNHEYMELLVKVYSIHEKNASGRVC